MKNTSLYLPGFHLETLRRKPRSASQKLADEKERIRRHSISQLGDCFSHLIPENVLNNDSNGSFSRRRIFSRANTFWAFFYRYLMLMVVAGKSFVKYKPLLRPSRDPFHQRQHRLTARPGAN